MSKARETSTDKNYLDLGPAYDISETDSVTKTPNWVNLAQLDGPLDDSLVNKIVYKPALRFHGFGGGLWGQGLSDAPSVMSDSQPPSYRHVASIKARESCSTCEGSSYNNTNMSTVSPLTLRRRNTVAVVLVAIALLAAVAAITGLVLHFLHPKAMLRANVRFTIANHNFTDDMRNDSTIDFNSISRPLCKEMDVYFLTSELAEFYLGCKVVTLRDSNNKQGIDVHHTLDFVENKVTNDGERIKKIILRKSGRLKTNDDLYLVVRDFHIHLRSLRIDLEKRPLPDGHPSSTRPRIPWNDDFIPRKFDVLNNHTDNNRVLIDSALTPDVLSKRNRTHNTTNNVPKDIMPLGKMGTNGKLTPQLFNHTSEMSARVPSVFKVNPVQNGDFKAHANANVPTSKSATVVNVTHGGGNHINPTKASVFNVDVKKSNELDNVPDMRELMNSRNIKAEERAIHENKNTHKIVTNNKKGDKTYIDNKSDHKLSVQDTGKQDYHEGGSFRANKHKHMPIDASFPDITDATNTEYTATPLLSNSNAHMKEGSQFKSEDDSQKVYTIFSDVFLILGTTTFTSSLMTQLPSPSIMSSPTYNLELTDSQIVLKAEKSKHGDYVHELSVNESSTPVPNVLASVTNTNDDYLSIPKLLFRMDTPVKVYFSRAPELRAYPSELDMNKKLIPTKTSGIKPSISISNTDKSDIVMTRLANEAPPQLNEMIELPVKETPLMNDNIEWVNIFSKHKPMTNISVGEIGSLPTAHALENPIDEQQINANMLQIKHQNSDAHNQIVGITMPVADGFLGRNAGNISALVNDIHNGLSLDHDTNVMKFFDRIMGDDTATNNAVLHNNNLIPDKTFQTFHQNKITDGSKRTDHDAGYYQHKWKQGSRIHMQSSTDTQRPGFVTSEHLPRLDTRQMASLQFSNQIANANSDRMNIPVPSSIPNTVVNMNRQLLPAFTLRSGIHKGRPAFILSRPGNGNQQLSNPGAGIQQPWNFLNNIGFNPSTTNRNSVTTTNNRRTHFSGTSSMLTQTRRHSSKSYLIRTGNTGYGLNQVIRWNNQNPRFTTRRFRIISPRNVATRLLTTNTVGRNPSIKMTILRGLPGYGDFEDISKMKDILKDLVLNMLNMTEKLDKMQDAIDYINKTFHETHEPMFKLEETLGNMTVSLGNFNQNLDNINQTLRRFKEFLKSFDNTVFNIDDVIRHIDDTINTLGKAARYVEYSVMDINGTTLGVNGDLGDIDTTLNLMNKTVFDVNYSSVYSNETLDSMKNTLDSLENAVSKLNLKVRDVVGGSDVISLSLKDINSTVINTHDKLHRLHSKLQRFNNSMANITNTVSKLNETYYKINKTLENMNEPYVFVNGTVLEVIEQLNNMDGTLKEFNSSMVGLKGNMTNMNTSLINSMDWVNEMVDTLVEFNLKINDDTKMITVSLQNKDLIKTIGVLIEMNGTLTEIGDDVGDINVKLDKMEIKLNGLGKSLSDLDKTLENIDAAFKILNTTINIVNTTVNETEKSLKSMNFTVQRINTTIADLGVSFGNINETLDVINETIATVNKTSINVTDKLQTLNKTFQELIESTKGEIDSTNRLKTSLMKFEGSTSVINNQLYNANESLRIVRSKSEIMDESYRILLNTLINTNAIVDELQAKLVDTSKSMDKTNASFGSVNKSLSAIEDSYAEITSKLAELMESFSNMNRGFTEMGSAFPNMMASIQKTKEIMENLEDIVQRTKFDLTAGLDRRDTLYDRYLEINLSLKHTTEFVNRTASFLNDIKDTSVVGHDHISKLKEAVTETKDKYDTVEKNVKYINLTHDILFVEFKSLGIERSRTDNDIVNTTILIQDMEQDLKGTFESFMKYDNLETPLVDLQTRFKAAVKTYNETLDAYNFWTGKFETADGMLWNPDGSPNGVYSDFDDLLNNSTAINDTFLNYSTAIEQIANIMDYLRGFKVEAGSHFDRNNLIQALIDDVNKNERALNDTINGLGNELKARLSTVKSKMKDLENKLKAIENLQEKYGDINGTLNNSSLYDDMRLVIITEIENMATIEKKLLDMEQIFNTTVENFKQAKQTYQGTTFDLMPASEKLLKEILSAFNNTDLTLADMTTNLANLTNNITATDESFDDLTNGLLRMEEILDYKKDKHNYISTNRPQIVSNFNLTLSIFNKTLAGQEGLFLKLESLQKTVTKLLRATEYNDVLSNVNLGVFQEQQNITSLRERLTKLVKVTHLMKDDLLSDYNTYERFNETSHSLDEIKALYQKYQDKLDIFDNFLSTSNSSLSEIDTNVDELAITLDDLLRQLDLVYETHELIKATNETLDSLQLNITDVSQRLDNAHHRLHALEDEFNRIKQNYTNFTATDIDLSSSYVNEALSENQMLMDTLLMEFKDANDSSIEIIDLFNLTNKLLTEQDLNRYNIDSSLGKDVLAYIGNITKNTGTVQRDLNSILARIDDLHLFVEGINETIHVTNKQLFEDRQKKLLADQVFTKLETDEQLVNNSLERLEDLLNTTSSQLDDVYKTYKQLDIRLNSFPTANISLSEIGEKLAHYNTTLQQATAHIDAGKKRLKTINGTMWVDNKRYSNDQTIVDMKVRYADVQDMLNELIKDMSILESDIGIVGNNTSEIKNDLTNVNNSLNKLDRTHTILNRLERELDLLTDSFDNTNGLVDDIIFNISTVDADFNNITERFKHIDPAVFDNDVKPFKHLLSDTNKSLADLSGNINMMNNDIGIAEQILAKAQQIRNATVDNKNGLDEKIGKKLELFKELEALIDTIETNLKLAANNSGVITDIVNNLEGELDNMGSIFESQEKEEYFNAHFPGPKYESFIDNISQMEDMLSNTEQSLDHVNNAFVTMRTDVSEIDNLQFDTESVGQSLQLINATLNNNKLSIISLKSEYKDAEILLTAAGGQLIGQNETIQEMKDRYDRLAVIMDGFVNTIKDLKDSFVHTNSGLLSNNKTIRFINDVLRRFEDTIGDITRLNNQTSSIASVVDDKIKADTIRGSKHAENKLRFKSLLNRFNGTSSEHIEERKGAITASVDLHGTNVEDITNRIATANKTLASTTRLLQTFNDTLLDSYADPTTLNTVLDTFGNIKAALVDNMNSINGTMLHIENDATAIDKQQLELADDINLLERQFKEQEKLDFMQKNGPKLQKQISVLKDVKNSTESDVAATNSSIVQLSGLLERVQDILSSDVYINIPLLNIRNESLQLRDDVERLARMLSKTDTEISKFNLSMLHSNGTYFNENDSIHDIKAIYETLNETLNNLTDSIGRVELENIDINTSSSNIIDVLNDLKSEIEKHTQLKQNVTQTNSEINKLSNNAERAKRNWTEIHTGVLLLHDSLANTVLQYKDVKEPDLHRDSIELLRQIGNLNDIHNALGSHVDSFLDNIMDTKERGNTFTGLMESIVATMRELRDKNTNGTETHGHIVRELRSLSPLLYEILANITHNEEIVKSLKKEVKDLREGFKKQQIYEYIEENFPIVLQVYRNVNDSITRLTDKAPDVIEQMNIVNTTFGKIDSMINNEHSLHISLESDGDKIALENNRMRLIMANVGDIVKQFGQMEDVISNSVGSNETLAEIKERFGGYGDVLADMNADIKQLNVDLDTVRRESNETHNNLTDFQQSIERYTTQKEVIKMVKDEANDAGNKLSLTNSAYNDILDMFNKFLNETIEMKTRFKDINDTHLNSRQRKLTNVMTDRHSQLNSTGREVLKEWEVDENLQNDFKEIIVVLTNNITDRNQLIGVNEDIKKRTTKIIQIIKKIKNQLIDKLNPDINTHNESLKNITKLIDSLNNDYLEKEKADYISENIPPLVNKYNAVDNMIGEVENRLNSTKFRTDEAQIYIRALQRQIDEIPQIQISLSRYIDKLNNVNTSSNDTNTQLVTNKTIFQTVPSELFTKDNWTDYSIDEVKHTLNNMDDNISRIATNAALLNSSVTSANRTIRNQMRGLIHTNSVVEKYKELTNRSMEVGGDLEIINKKITDTNELLNNVKTKLTNNTYRLNNLTLEFDGVSSPEIEQYIQKIRMITGGTVGLRIPLAETLISKKLFENYNIINSRFEDVVYTLNNTYSKRDDLENNLERVEEYITNITLETEIMNADDKYFREDANTNLELLKKSDTLLNELEDLFRRQKKLDVLNTAVPRLNKEWTRHNVDIDDLVNALKDRSSSLSETDTFQNQLDLKLNSMPTLNISMAPQRADITSIYKTVYETGQSIVQLNDSLQQISVFDINIEKLVSDEKVRVQDVAVLIENMNKMLLNVNDTSKNINASITDIADNTTIINVELQLLNKTLSCFKKVETKLNALNTSYSEVNITFDVTVGALFDAGVAFTNHRNAMRQLQNKYNDFNYNNTYLETLLNATDQTLSTLNDVLANTTIGLKSTGEQISAMHDRFYMPADDRVNLNTTLTLIKFDMIGTEKDLAKVNSSLNYILRNVPLLNVSIDNIQKQLTSMNSTLKMEKLKSDHKESVLPILEDAYKRVSFTFDMTNKTLLKMADEIDALNTTVADLRKRINGFQTINISTSDMYSNITHLENRLAIMKDNYNNVQEVLIILQDDMETHSVLGKNISITDVEEQYEKFNNSMNMANDVLSKIESEAFKMANHFDELNDTVVNVNKALDKFEKKETKTKAMSKNINDLGEEISLATENIFEMEEVVKNLSASFNAMQNKYKAVFDKTSENNTLVMDLLANAGQTLKEIRIFMGDLEQRFNQSADKFSKMNETLFKDISTFMELTDTLKHVKETHDELSASLAQLAHGISGAATNRTGMNSAISELTTLLDNLDGSLNLEQLKYDFLQSNFDELDNKVKGLESPSESTASLIENISKNVDDTFVALKNVSSKMKMHSNVQIPLSKGFRAVDAVNDSVINAWGMLKNIKDSYANLRQNVSSLVDSAENVTEIQARYGVLNESLDELKSGLQDMHVSLENANSNATDVLIRAGDLHVALETLESLKTSTVNTHKRLDTLNADARNKTNSIADVNLSALTLKDTLSNMTTMYESVDDPVLKTNLSAVIDQLKEKLFQLQTLNDSQSKLNDRISNINGSIIQNKLNINQQIRSTKELDGIIQESNSSLSVILNQTSALEIEQSNLNDQIKTLTASISKLVAESEVLNQTLAEEKAKRDFISRLYPLMESKFNSIGNILNDSIQRIEHVSGDINSTESELISLHDRMNTVREINIPLNDEERQLKKMKVEMDNNIKIYSNISQLYKGINISKLQDKSMSFEDLQRVYSDFDKETRAMIDTLKTVDTTAGEIADSNTFLKDSVRDINDTIDHFTEVNAKLESTVKTSQSLTNNLTKTNDAVTDMTNELQNLDKAFNDIVHTFKHIKDANLAKVKNSLDKIMGTSKRTLKDLQTSVTNLSVDNSQTNKDIAVMNATLSSTKVLLDQLKNHIRTVNETSNSVLNNIDKINNTHTNIESTVNGVPLELKQILDTISKLNDSYVKEQEKLEFIARHKPVAEKRFADLQDVLNGTNMKLSLTEVELANLKYAINTIGEKVDKFKVLNISTDPELNVWKELRGTVDTLFQSFSSISGEYRDLQNTINGLDDRSQNLTEIEKKFNELDATLENLEQRTRGISKQLDNVKTKVKETDAILNGFTVTIESLKSVQTLAEKTRQDIGNAVTISDDVTNRIKSMTNIAELTATTLDVMKTKYAPLANKEWDRKHTDFTQNLTLKVKQNQAINKTHDKLQTQLTAVLTSYNSTKSTLDSGVLTRQNANESLLNMKNDLENSNMKLAKLSPGLSGIQGNIVQQEKDINALKSLVEDTNKTLHDELEKHNFVHEYLPPTQNKHSEVNASFIANTPNIELMKAQMNNLVQIIEQINNKMNAFGLTDTDNSIQAWDSMITKLNSTIYTVISDNKLSADKLTQLKADLWNEKPNYSKQESIAQLKTRFEEYNKTMDGIKASAHAIQIKLGNLTSDAEEVALQLTERDSILTTTPATTTPSGPPDWLSFTSSKTSTIGKDSSFVKCSVGNMEEWKVMKITRIQKNGRKTAVAAWKLGSGARKAVRDRRVRVRKTEDGVGGGSLFVNIKSVQCEDEGTYYCTIDSYEMYPLEATISVITPPEDNLRPDFPTEVFEDKVANFSCTGHPGYPHGKLSWKVKHDGDVDFKPFTFYSARATVKDTDCIRTETNKVEYQFEMSWNNTKIRCYIDNTQYYGEGLIRLLPYDICNSVRYLGTIVHPYTPHKYIVCGKALNIMECPGKTCYDEKEENCVQCKATHGNGDPCQGQPLFSYVAHETDCKKYYICMGPTKATKTCAKGYFQPNTPGNCIMSYQQSHCGQTKG